VKVQLHATARAAGQARAATTTFLTRESLHTVSRDDALLAVSEIVTNAVKAGANHICLEMASSGASLTILVEDDAEGWPTVQHPSYDSESGRGLNIVEQLADAWDVRRTQHGKVVTVTFHSKT